MYRLRVKRSKFHRRAMNIPHGVVKPFTGVVKEKRDGLWIIDFPTIWWWHRWDKKVLRKDLYVAGFDARRSLHPVDVVSLAAMLTVSICLWLLFR